MTPTGAHWVPFHLAEAVASNGCGWIFDKNGIESSEDYDHVLAAVAKADSNADFNMENPEAYERPDEQRKRVIERAKTYDDMHHWRSFPLGAVRNPAYGAAGEPRFILAPTVGQMVEAQLNTAYLGKMAKAWVRQATRLPGGVTAERINDAFGTDFTDPLFIPPARRTGAVGSTEWNAYFSQVHHRLRGGAGAAAAPAPGARGPGILAARLTQHAAGMLKPFGGVLTSLAGSEHGRAILDEMDRRLESCGDDTSKVDAHVKHALEKLDSLGLRPGTASPVAAREHAAEFIRSLPPTAALAATKVLPRTDAVWAPAGVVLAASPDIAAADRLVGAPALSIMSWTRVAEMEKDFASHSKESLAVLVAIMAMPFTIPTIQRLAHLGMPIVSGSIERYSSRRPLSPLSARPRYGMMFRGSSMLLLKSGETVDNIQTPMTTTLSSHGPRRKTGFTWNFGQGFRWIDKSAITEMPCAMPEEFGGGMNTTLMENLDELRALLLGRSNPQTRADCLFVPCPVTERTKHYPANFLAEIVQRDDSMGDRSQQIMSAPCPSPWSHPWRYRKHSGHQLMRRLLGASRDPMEAQILERVDHLVYNSLAMHHGAKMHAACIVIHRGATMGYSGSTQKYDKQRPGTGPFGAMRMHHHHHCADVFSGHTGRAFPPEGPTDAGL
jgi:hypothetical protein